MTTITADFDVRSAQQSVFAALLEARGKYGGKREIIHDADDRKLTYNDLVQASFALGSALRKGTKSGEAVGVLLPTGAGAVIAFFALNAFGRVPAMLNFTAGARNLKAAFKAGQIKTVVTAHRFIDVGGLDDLVSQLEDEVDFVYLEDVRENLGLRDKLAGGLGPLMPWVFRAKPSHNAAGVILFTSGTEGDPKGVVLSHVNVVANVKQILAHVPDALTTDDTVFNPLPTFHCFGLTAGALLPLFGGMKAVFHPSPLHVKEIPKRIEDTKSTLLFATDTFLSQYVRASSGEELSKLRFAICGAERVRDETRQLVKRKCELEILEGYGATEASPVLAVNQPGANRPGTVGRALPGLELFFEPVPGINSAGRMKVRGPNVMSGYLQIDKPGVIQPLDGGWHDTGDVVSRDDEGYLTIRGRIKRFAKIGGEMVSLAVVENCASAVWPDHDHAAASIPDPRKGEQIVLLSTNAEADRSELVAWAQTHGVSELSLPRKIYHVDEVPVLGTGKMDLGGIQHLAAELSAPKPEITAEASEDAQATTDS
ncbi:MAG: AMP-binding protein [Pseudomonadota bacterium]